MSRPLKDERLIRGKILPEARPHFGVFQRMKNSKSIVVRSDILKGRKAIISGAGKGIGRAIAIQFAANGADICVVSRTAEDVKSLQSKVRREYNVKFVGFVADVSTKEGAEEIVSRASLELGGVDILICAAGYPIVNEIWERKLHELAEEDFLHVFNVDVLGSFRLIKDVIPLMIKNKGGVIILFSSTPALAGYDRGGPYTVAKAANLGLVKELAYEYGKDDIRVYAIAPGNIRTKRTFDQLSEKEQKKLEDETPMKRWGDPDEVAGVAVVLASDKMSFVTGQTVVVDGGTVML